MKIQPIMHVTGIRIELSLDEAIHIAQNRKRNDRIVDNIRSVLRGSGVDPDTGEKVPSALGLQPAIVKSLPPAKETSFECPHCGKPAKTEQGIKLHITRMHPTERSQEDEE